MKGILERSEEVTKELSSLHLQNIKLSSLKVATDSPNTGSFRIKATLIEGVYIEIF